MLPQVRGNIHCYSYNHTSLVSHLLRRSRLGSSSTVAQQRRSSHVADYAKGLGALVSSNRIPEAISLLEGFLEQKRRLHALSTGDLLEGEGWYHVCGCEHNWCRRLWQMCGRCAWEWLNMGGCGCGMLVVHCLVC